MGNELNLVLSAEGQGRAGQDRTRYVSEQERSNFDHINQ